METYNYILRNNFIFVNQTNRQLIPRYKELNIRASDVNIFILYKCNETDIDCQIPEEYKQIFFGVSYHGFVLDHQNDDSALHKGTVYMDYFLEIHSSDPSIFTSVKYNTDAGFKKILV